MEKEIFARLDALAAKLGVAVDKLLELYLRQQLIDGVLSIVWAMVGVFIVLIGRNSMHKYKTTKKYDSDYAVTGYFCYILGSLVVLLALSCAAYDFGNPELEAFKELMSDLK